MLGWRLAMSCVLIPSIAGLFWLDHRMGSSALILLVFACFVAVRNAWELCDLLRVRSMKPLFLVTAPASLLLVLAGWLHLTPVSRIDGGSQVLISLGWIGATIVLTFCALMVVEAVRYDQPGSSMESLGTHLLIILYAGGLMSATAQLRWFPDPSTGYFVIASMILCVKSGDTFAYTFGRLWGKRKLAPKLSPGKTWMGFAGAIVGSTLAGWLWLTFAGSLFAAKPVAGPLWIVLLYSACLGAVGLIGDLVESLIKRDAGKKDSAALMPGFGGLLDLLDSPLFAGPLTLLWWHILPPATFVV